MLHQFLLYSKVNQHQVSPFGLYNIYLLFWISFPFRSLQSINQSSLCYTVNSHQSSILYIIVYICQPYSPKSCQPLPRSISLHSFSTSFSLLCSPSAKLEQHLDQKMLLSFLLFIVFLSRISYLNLVWSMGIIRRVFFRRFFFFFHSL